MVGKIRTERNAVCIWLFLRSGCLFYTYVFHCIHAHFQIVWHIALYLQMILSFLPINSSEKYNFILFWSFWLFNALTCYNILCAKMKRLIDSALHFHFVYYFPTELVCIISNFFSSTSKVFTKQCFSIRAPLWSKETLPVVPL